MFYFSPKFAYLKSLHGRKISGIEEIENVTLGAPLRTFCSVRYRSTCTLYSISLLEALVLLKFATCSAFCQLLCAKLLIPRGNESEKERKREGVHCWLWKEKNPLNNILPVDCTEPVFLTSWSPGIDSKELIPPAYLALAGWYDYPFPPRFLATIDWLKVPAQYSNLSEWKYQ